MNERYTQSETDALKAIRAATPSVAQRELAAELNNQTTRNYGSGVYWAGGMNHDVPNRTQQSLYGAIRRIDRANKVAASTQTGRGRRNRFGSAV